MNRISGLFPAIVAFIATCGSLFFSEIMYFYPCNLCWYQRILMYPLTIICFVGFLRKHGELPFYVLPLSIMGTSTAFYHYLLQNGFFAGNTCTGLSCATRYVNYYGFITIPFLSLIAFSLITLIMIFKLKKKKVGDF